MRDFLKKFDVTWLAVIAGLFAAAVAASAHAAEGETYTLVDMSNCLTISWNPSPGATDYRVITGQDRTAMSTAIETTSTTVTCAEAKITGFGQWYFRVRGRNAAGLGAYAEVPFFLEQKLLPPAAPTGLKITVGP